MRFLGIIDTMTNELPDVRPTPLTAELAPAAALLHVLDVTGNLTRAAAVLGIPQPTASRRLAALSARVGTPLTVADGRGLRLTRVGHLLAGAAGRAIDALEHGVRQVGEEIDPASGHVVLGFLHLLGRSLVPTLVRDFRAGNPHVRFSLVQGSRDDIVTGLASGTVDLALVAPPPAAPGLDSVVLDEQELFLAVPADHRLADRAGVGVAELAGEVFVLLEHGYGLRQITDELCAEAGFTPTVAFEGQESDTVRGLVAAGLGVALLPAFGPRPPSGVAEIRLDPPVTREIGLAWPAGHPLPPAVTAFRDFVRQHARAGGPAQR